MTISDPVEAPYAAEAERQILASIRVLESSREAVGPIARAAAACIRSIRSGGKILVCGNGGSAAAAQHIAAELVNKYCEDRRPLPGLALTTDGSNLTAIGNDCGYDLVFAKQVTALGKPGDVLLAISTSGNSPSVLEAIQAARSLGITTIGLTGRTGGRMCNAVDILVNLPSDETPRIQEAQQVAAHVLCHLIERECG